VTRPGPFLSAVASDSQVRRWHPHGHNVLYLTMSATGRALSPDVPIWFQCRIDGGPCTPGVAHAVGPAFPGWISLLRHHDVEGDANGMHYTWCRQLFGTGGGTHTFEVRMASGVVGNQVAIEAAHFYIDSNQFFNPTGAPANACTSLDTAGTVPPPS
jgi:hypothetical protein